MQYIKITILVIFGGHLMNLSADKIERVHKKRPSDYSQNDPSEILKNNIQNYENDKLNLFEGKWIGEGTLFNNKASFEMEWKHVLNNKFWQLSFHNQFTDKENKIRSMDAIAYYKENSDAQITGYWCDSRGVSFPIEGKMEDSLLTVLWGDSNEKGKTTYSISENRQSIEVADYFFKNNEYILFGRAQYLKK